MRHATCAMPHETLKIKFLGRKGLISNLFSQLGKIQAKDRPKYGNDLNNLKNDILSFFNENEKVSQTVSSESLDLSLPGQKFKIGLEHPLQKTLNEIKIGGAGFGFWMAQQGSIYVFVVLIFIYVRLMNRLEGEYASGIKNDNSSQDLGKEKS